MNTRACFQTKYVGLGNTRHFPEPTIPLSFICYGLGTQWPPNTLLTNCKGGRGCVLLSSRRHIEGGRRDKGTRIPGGEHTSSQLTPGRSSGALSKGGPSSEGSKARCSGVFLPIVTPLLMKGGRRWLLKDHQKAAGLINSCSILHSLLEALPGPAAEGTDSWNRYLSLSQKFFGNIPMLCHLNP